MAVKHKVGGFLTLIVFAVALFTVGPWLVDTATEPPKLKPGTRTGRDNRIILFVDFKPNPRNEDVIIIIDEAGQTPLTVPVREISPEGWVVIRQVTPTTKIRLVASQKVYGRLFCSINWVANAGLISDDIRDSPGQVRCHYP